MRISKVVFTVAVFVVGLSAAPAQDPANIAELVKQFQADTAAKTAADKAAADAKAKVDADKASLLAAYAELTKFLTDAGIDTSVNPEDVGLSKFQVAVKKAFKADKATKDQLAKYAALWRVAATTTVLDPGITSAAALYAEMQVAVKALGLPAGCLNQTARAVADEINPSLPKTWTDADRKAMAATFTRVAADLDKVGGK